MQEESYQKPLSSKGKKQTDFFHEAVIFGYAALAFIFLEYFARAEFFINQFPQLTQEHFGLYPFLWWAGWTVLLFLLVPGLIVKLVFKHRLVDYGLTLKVAPKYLLLYLAMFLAVLPLVLYASTREDFRAIYPFFRGALNAPVADIIVWEVAYLSTFIALEFFFRGFMVLGLTKRFGRLAIWVAMVPYVMLHFHKPPLEAVGAIFAGLILGEVSQRTRSILGGVIVHIGVAATMDFMAIN